MAGQVPGVLNTPNVWELHQVGHEVASALKKVHPAKFKSLAHLFRDVSDLAGISLDEAFAEGYIISRFDPQDLNGQVLTRSVSRLSVADPIILEEDRRARPLGESLKGDGPYGW